MAKSETKKTKSIQPAPIENQLEMIIDEVTRFITLGKEQGYLTIEEINDLLPQEIVDASVLDHFMHSLEMSGIEVKVSDGAGNESAEGTSTKADGDEDEEASDSKSNDPVRLYLKKMGGVSLLTREGEVEIATRIENGEREIVRAILLSPIGTNEIILLGKRLDEGRI